MSGRVLVIDDEADACEMLISALERRGIDAKGATSATEALEVFAHEPFDVVLTDVGMPGVDGLELCTRVAELAPSVPVVVVTGRGDLDTAIGAIRAGAYDFMVKPIDLKLLSLVVERALKHKALHDEIHRLRSVLDAATVPSLVIGTSSPMRRVEEVIARIAASDATVLVSGETGTGKELVARRIHAVSARRGGPFVSINCAAVPQSLLESELFGHARGAFTDAKGARVGLFVEADSGTLFLDEIGDMPLEMQSKLLRALQERTVRPVGANAETSFDARIIAATNRDLEEDVERKRFREDLFYRINVVRIDVPPLRERGGDVLELAQTFVSQQAARSKRPVLGLSAPAAQKLLAYHWPGNVRELENCIERAVAFARFDEITVDDLPEKVRHYRADRFSVEANDTAEIVTLDELERRYIARVLALLGSNKVRAAQRLGIDRRTLYRKLERWSGPSSSDDGDQGPPEPPPASG